MAGVGAALWGARIEGLEHVGQLLLGLVALLTGGEWLVHGSVSIARRLGMSTLLIGLTLVAFGTSAPELAFNIFAAWDGATDLCFGNVVGSNIANVGLVLGLCAALYSPLSVHGQIVRRELPLLASVSALLIALALLELPAGVTALSTGGVDRLDGAVLLAGFGLFVVQSYRAGKRQRGDVLLAELEGEVASEPDRPFGTAALLAVAGIAGLAAGGKISETGAVGLAHWVGLSDRFIGVTVIAVATSLPEVFASVIACRHGHKDLAIGNVVGSNVFNTLLVLGATAALVQPIGVPGWEGAADLIVMMLLTLALWLFAVTGSRHLSRFEGVALLLTYAAYLGFCVAREV